MSSDADNKGRNFAPEGWRTSVSASLRKALPWIGSAVVVAAAVTIYMLAHARPDPQAAADRERGIPGASSVQVQVLNASGNDGMALRLTDFLRSRGYDVVDIGNAVATAHTAIVDRSGKSGAATGVAEAMGLKNPPIRRQIDPKLFLDVTVVLGRDAGTLSCVRTQSWRNDR